MSFGHINIPELRTTKDLEGENEPRKAQPDVMGRILKTNDKPRLKRKDGETHTNQRISRRKPGWPD